MASEILDPYGNPVRRESRFHSVATKTRITQDTNSIISGGFLALESPTDDADWKFQNFSEERLATLDFNQHRP